MKADKKIFTFNIYLFIIFDAKDTFETMIYSSR